MKMSTAFKYLFVALRENVRVCLIGDPGIGKTSIVKAFAKAISARLIEIHVAEWDSVDLKGFPVIIDEVPRFIPYGEMAEILTESDDRIILFFDDLGHGDDYILKQVIQVLGLKSYGFIAGSQLNIQDLLLFVMGVRFIKTLN